MPVIRSAKVNDRPSMNQENERLRLGTHAYPPVATSPAEISGRKPQKCRKDSAGASATIQAALSQRRETRNGARMAARNGRKSAINVHAGAAAAIISPTPTRSIIERV